MDNNIENNTATTTMAATNASTKNASSDVVYKKISENGQSPEKATLTYQNINFLEYKTVEITAIWKRDLEHIKSGKEFTVKLAKNDNSVEEITSKFKQNKTEQTIILKDNVIVTDNGSLYIGAILNKMPNGAGKIIYKNGDIYEGEWENGKQSKNGKGRITYENGDIYEGEWKDSKRDGNGKYTYKNGDICEGLWENGQLKTPSQSVSIATNRHIEITEICDDIVSINFPAKTEQETPKTSPLQASAVAVNDKDQEKTI